MKMNESEAVAYEFEQEKDLRLKAARMSSIFRYIETYVKKKAYFPAYSQIIEGSGVERKDIDEYEKIIELLR